MVYQKLIFADMGRQRKTDWMRWLGGLQCEANGSEKLASPSSLLWALTVTDRNSEMARFLSKRPRRAL